MTTKTYTVMKQDQRDGAESLVQVTMVDELTGATSTVCVAVFRPQFDQAAKEYVDWLNSRVGKG